MRYYKNTLLPKSIFIPYLIIKILLFPLIIFRKIFPLKKENNIILEAGHRGWESIEFKELYATACEYIGTEKVNKIVYIEKGNNFSLLKKKLREHQPTHFFYDPRTLDGNYLSSLWRSIRLSFILHRKGITPIVLLTDFSLRSFRLRSAILTAYDGIVITFLSARIGQGIYPHRRLLGPMPMPLSLRTLKSIHTSIQQNNIVQDVIFTGSLYEPRATILKKIKYELSKKEIELNISGRAAGGKRSPDEEYWNNLVNSKIVLTTTNQIANNDWSWINQMIYRFLEVTACGSMLMANTAPGIERFFTPGEHFISFDSPEEAAQLIDYYLKNEKERIQIATNGKQRADAMIKSRVFWNIIDTSLGPKSIT